MPGLVGFMPTGANGYHGGRGAWLRCRPEEHNPMTLTAPATPWLAKVPLGADGQTHALLIVHADQAIAPTPALRQVVEFEDNGQGGFISAAQALDCRWGYIDAQGQWLIAPTLDNARGFSDDGLARFCRDGRWGYIDLLAQEVIAAQFEDARPLRNGLAAVKVGPQGWRIIDRQGRFRNAAAAPDFTVTGHQSVEGRFVGKCGQ